MATETHSGIEGIEQGNLIVDYEALEDISWQKELKENEIRAHMDQFIDKLAEGLQMAPDDKEVQLDCEAIFQHCSRHFPMLLADMTETIETPDEGKPSPLIMFLQKGMDIEQVLAKSEVNEYLYDRNFELCDDLEGMYEDMDLNLIDDYAAQILREELLHEMMDHTLEEVKTDILEECVERDMIREKDKAARKPKLI